MDRDFDFSLKAEANVNRCRFVKLTANDNGCLLAAAAADVTIGISYDGSAYAPGIGGNDETVQAYTGQTVPVYGPGRKCLLELGGTATAGQRLTSDATGRGVVATTGNEVGARCLQGGTVGRRVLVLVEHYKI